MQDGGDGFFFRGWAFRCAGTLTRHIPVPARSNTLPCVLVRPLRASLTDDVHHRLSVSLWPQDVTDDLRDMAHRAGEKPRCANPLSVRAQGEHGGKVLMLCNTYRTRAFITVRLTDLARAGHHLAQTGRNRGRLGRHARTGCGGPPSASACLLASAPRALLRSSAPRALAPYDASTTQRGSGTEPQIFYSVNIAALTDTSLLSYNPICGPAFSLSGSLTFAAGRNSYTVCTACACARWPRHSNRCS